MNAYAAKGGGASGGKNSLNNNNNSGGGGGGGSGGGGGIAALAAAAAAAPPSTGGGGGAAAGGGLNPNNILSQLREFDSDAINTQINMDWINKPWVQSIVRACAFCSFISICLNTPETFKHHRPVMFLTYALDLVCTGVFTVEMLAKIKIRGLLRGDKAYIFDRWCQFDGIMVLFHLISVILQVFYPFFLLLLLLYVIIIT